MFLARASCHRGVIEINCGMSNFLTFTRKKQLYELISGLNDIFHWYAQLEILIKSSFSCNNDRLISWTTEKIEVSSAKSLAVDDRFLDKSLIYTKNNRGPKTDPWGTPASAGYHEDDWPFNKALWNLFDKKLSMHFSGSPDIPKDCSL